MNHAHPTPETLAEATARRDAAKRRLPEAHTPYGAGLTNAERLKRYLDIYDADAAVQRAYRDNKRVPLVVSQRINGGVLV
jgi:hypothetical protein